MKDDDMFGYGVNPEGSPTLTNETEEMSQECASMFEMIAEDRLQLFYSIVDVHAPSSFKLEQPSVPLAIVRSPIHGFDCEFVDCLLDAFDARYEREEAQIKLQDRKVYARSEFTKLSIQGIYNQFARDLAYASVTDVFRIVRAPLIETHEVAPFIYLAQAFGVDFRIYNIVPVADELILRRVFDLPSGKDLVPIVEKQLACFRYARGLLEYPEFAGKVFDITAVPSRNVHDENTRFIGYVF